MIDIEDEWIDTEPSGFHPYGSIADQVQSWNRFISLFRTKLKPTKYVLFLFRIKYNFIRIELESRDNYDKINYRELEKNPSPRSPHTFSQNNIQSAHTHTHTHKQRETNKMNVSIKKKIISFVWYEDFWSNETNDQNKEEDQKKKKR